MLDTYTSPTPRAPIEAISYKVRLPDGNVTYPNLTTCLPNQTFTGVGALALDDLGVAVLAAGIEQLYGPETAHLVVHQWQHKTEPSHTRLPSMVTLRTLNNPNDKPVSWMSREGFTLAATPPEVISRCGSNGMAHDPKN